MILERSDVQFPMWRKKVDRSLLQHGVTPLPGWVAAMWGIDVDFESVESKRSDKSSVKIVGQDMHAVDDGWVTSLTKGRTAPLYRLFLGDVTKAWLRQSFRMTYLRSIEFVLARGIDDTTESDAPFWEFVDIEYDRNARMFNLVAHYQQQVVFPHAMATLLDGVDIEDLATETTASGIDHSS